MINFKLLKVPFIVFLILYFLYLVVSRTPAAWAAWGVHQAIPSLWLSSAEGTLWRGQARSAQVDIGPASIPLGTVNWRLNPWSLLVLKPCVDFSTRLPRQTLEGEFCQHLNGKMTIRNLSVDAPVQVIEQINPIDASGVISLQVVEAEFDSKAYVSRLDGRFSWQNARAFAIESWLSLGTFAATASEDGNGGVSAKVFDIEGPYKVDLTAGLKHGETGWLIDGTIAPDASAPIMVAQFLQAFGEEVAEGSYRIQWP